METKERELISVQAVINAPVEKVWESWTNPEDIKKWNHASEDWYTPEASNDLRPGGKFNYRMESRDGKSGFDFWGIYNNIIEYKIISYGLGDGRKATVTFSALGNKTSVVETFEAEKSNSAERQRTGWQAILNNFKTYTETKNR